MITAADLEYHHSDGDDYRWTETYYLPISVPEEHIFAHIYVATKPTLGVMSNNIRIHGDTSATEWEALYDDHQAHLPAPERFSQLHGPNGLSIVATNPPRDFRIDYVGYDDTEIHVDWLGIMHPHDSNDPELNPLIAGTSGAEERDAHSSMGSGYRGHMDMHGRVTGTLKVRGRELQVDTVDRMDHSWGPRPELEIPPMNSVWASFGEEFCIRWHGSVDLDAPTGQDQKLSHGYVLDHGEVFALVDLKVSTRRLGIVPFAMNFTATDTRGREYTLHGVADAGAPMHSYPSTVTWFGLYHWEYEGRWSHGSVQENHPMVDETRRRGRFWTDRPARITT
jgi:hypothetical protein